jgi:hypothetical protein
MVFSFDACAAESAVCVALAFLPVRSWVFCAVQKTEKPHSQEWLFYENRF